MSFKVLVADDSTNIQKVVKIIYEEKGYDIIECHSESELNDKLSEQVDLVLLDFALSEDLSGYEIAEKIQESSHAKIIFLFGTFDTVDEEKIKQLGVHGYLFKPFDSDKLTGVTDSLLGDSTGTHQSISITDSGTGVTETAMSSLSSEETITKVVAPEDALGDETAWGIKIPSIIGDNGETEEVEGALTLNEDNQRIPEIIEGDLTKTIIGGINSLEVENEIEEGQNLYPSEQDLEYPDIIPEKKIPEDGHDQKEFSMQVPSSQLMPSKDLLEDLPEEENEKPEATEIVDMNLSGDGEKETLQKLKKQIFDELDDNLWNDDHSNTNIYVGELGKKVVEDNSTEHGEREDIVEKLKTEIYSDIRNEVIESLKLELPNILKEELIPYFEEHIKEYSRSAVEKGIWEILPDLAEKVITRELEQIRDSIDD